MCTMTGCEAWLEPAPFDAVRVTLKVPAPMYVCDGFCAVEVPPSPKSQAHDVGGPDEVSVKVTLWPGWGLEGEKPNETTGTVCEETVTLWLTCVEPKLFWAVRVTVKVPAEL
jgi:hypothetical protein